MWNRTEKGASSRFEFIFACVEAKQTTGLNHNQRDMRLIDTINKILQSYKSAELYREIKLRSALFDGKDLQVGYFILLQSYDFSLSYKFWELVRSSRFWIYTNIMIVCKKRLPYKITD